MNSRSIINLSVIVLLFVVSAPALFSQSPGEQRSLTLDEAVRIALERNMSITLSETRVESSGARITSAFGAFLPQINVSAGYSRQLSDGTIFVQGQPIPSSDDRSPNSYNVNASASVLLFDGFSRTANYNAAQTDLSASISDLNRTRQTVAYQTRLAYLNALRSEQIMEVRRTDLDVAREQLVRIRGMVEVGTAQVGSVYSQEAEIANAELALEQARTDLITWKNNLNTLLNFDPNTDLQLSSEGLAVSIDQPEIQRVRAELGSPEQLAQLLAKREDYQAARLRIESADAAVTAARSGYFPSISAGLGWGWQRTDPASSTNSAFSLNFNYTPFDGFRTSEQVQLAEAQRRTAEIEARQIELQMRSDLAQSLARLEGAERQLTAAQKAVAAARQNRFAADERYKVGVGNYTDYLLANAQYLNAQVNQVNAVFNYRLALFEVRYHLGQ